MVRTKADRVPTKAVGAKAPAKFGSSSTSKKSNSGKAKNYTGGNPYHPRETPDWQKPITSFMNKSSTTNDTESNASSSSKDNQDQDVEKSTNEEDDD